MPDGMVTPGPTRARAETNAPASTFPPSITAPGPMEVGLPAASKPPMTDGPFTVAP